VEPGIYTDRTKAIVKIEERIFTYPISDILLDPSVFKQRFAALQKRDPAWHLISWASDLQEELPDTDIMEADIVKLIDPTHEHYNENTDLNQYTVNRINYGPCNGEMDAKEGITYKLRAGKLWFDVEASQIELCGDGPVRLFYSGEGYKLRWGRIDGQKATKAEAEFYLLLGRYNRLYNPNNKSYYWDLDHARQQIATGRGQAIYSMSDGVDHLGHALVEFWEHEIGQKMTFYPELILDT
jgi:hypothetical protein